MSTNDHLVIGTAGGTFLSVMPNINSEDILKTMLLAALGALVSFSISFVLKWIIKKHKK